jgi:hypothetical protein
MPENDRHHYIPPTDAPNYRGDKTIYAGHLVGPNTDYRHYIKAFTVRLKLNKLIRILEGTVPEDA